MSEAHEAALIAFLEHLPEDDAEMGAYQEAFEEILDELEEGAPVELSEGTQHAPAGVPPRSRVRLAEPDRAATESASPIVDAIIERGAQAGIVVSDEVRRKVLARVNQLKKKT